MAIYFSVSVRNQMLDAIENAIGVSPVFELRSGVVPANETIVDTGLLLAEIFLPSDWLASSFGANKNIAGIWETLSANDTGTATYFRVKDSSRATTYLQGNVSLAGGGGELILDDVNILAGSPIKITSFSFTQTQGS